MMVTLAIQFDSETTTNLRYLEKWLIALQCGVTVVNKCLTVWVTSVITSSVGSITTHEQNVQHEA
ncbi:unnamed protein product [Rhodiola kirilowii]